MMRISSVILILISLVLISCNGAKHLSEGESLYLGPNLVGIKKKQIEGEKFKVKERTAKRVEVWMATLKSPNGDFMGIPFIRLVPMRLMFYNWFYTDKEEGFNHWMMNNFGEPPITVELVNPDVRLANAESALFARGHFEVEGRYEIKYRKNGTKAKVRYNFRLGPAYTIESLQVRADSAHPELDAIFQSHLLNTSLEIGEDFNLKKIEKDRNQLVASLRNQGYYYLNTSNVLILADTSRSDRRVKIRYQLARNLPGYQLEKAKIENVLVFLDGQFEDLTVDMGEGNIDSIQPELNSRVLNLAIDIKEGENYSLHKTRRSAANLSSLNVLKGMQIRYVPDPGDSTQLTGQVNMATANRFTLGFEGTVNTKSNHFIGPSIGVKLTQKNLFRGAENITYGIDAFYDFPTGIFAKSASNSTGLSLYANLSHPLKKNPMGLGRNSVEGLPKISTGLKFEWNDRQDYFRIINIKTFYGIGWKSNPYLSHRLNFVNITFNDLIETTPVFDSLLASSFQLRQSFEDLFFFGPSYTVIYNNTGARDRLHNFYAKFNAELSGNLVNAVQRSIDSEGDTKRNLFGLPYAQYLYFNSDLRHYINIGYNSQLITRLVGGVGWAYSNSEVIPYVKQFYVGGTNSLRPISARVIGPGTYLPTTEDLASNTLIINNSGDVVLQGNLEYRFPVLYKLKGALWSDFGNIYLLKDDPERPGGKFELDNFLDKMIVTGGIGLRLDFDYLVLRWDVGYILYYPWFEQGTRWSWQNPLDLYGGVIAIGYPF